MDILADKMEINKKMRESGASYKEIKNVLGISENTSRLWYRKLGGVINKKNRLSMAVYYKPNTPNPQPLNENKYVKVNIRKDYDTFDRIIKQYS